MCVSASVDHCYLTTIYSDSTIGEQLSHLTSYIFKNRELCLFEYLDVVLYAAGTAQPEHSKCCMHPFLKSAGLAP